MILTRDKILKEIKEGNISIEPLLEDMVGPASVDLHLGNIFRVFTKKNDIFHVGEDSDVEKITNLLQIKDGEYILLKPGETALGITKEKITLPPNISGWLEGRSRFARLGLGVHITSGFLQPGISNQQVLEISNLSPTALALYPGTRFCQIVFERCEGEARYEGKYKNQAAP